MTQIFFTPAADTKKQKLYCYINNFKQVVVAKVKGLKNRHCERVIFPAERFMFMADDNCELEIYQPANIGAIQEVIACSKLKTIEE